MKKFLAGMLIVGLGPAGALAQPPEGGPPDDGPPRFARGRDGDGPPRRPGRGPGPIMEALDADKDGALSADEISQASKALKLLDKDGDGKLGRGELRPPRGPRGGGDDPRHFQRRERGERPDGPPEARRGRRRGGPEGPRGRGPEGHARREFGPPEGRRGPPEGRAGRGPHILPPGARERLNLSEDQIEKIDALEEQIKSKVAEILEPEQLEQMKQMFRRGPRGEGDRGRFRGPPERRPGAPDRPRPPRDRDA